MNHEIPGFSSFVWTNEDISKTVYQRGGQNHPPVILMHELPGMVPQCIALAEELADEGFSVYMPLLLGKPGSFSTVGNLLRICLSREFFLFARQDASPITNWLRSLCREAHQRSGGLPVGAIGMCLTGGFALSLMLEPSFLAPVLSQPSLPVGITQTSHASLGMASADLERVRQRSEEHNIPVLGLRFSCDPLCRDQRFETLSQVFGERFRKIEIDSSLDNPHELSRFSHSVLTIHRVKEPGHPTQQAYQSVVRFLREQLYS